jgi:hypothetical protein
MCKNTTPIGQPCTIVTPAQLEAEQLLKNVLKWGNPAEHRETLHYLFMNWLYDVAEDKEDMSSERIGGYQHMHRMLLEMEKWAAKHAPAKQEGVAA